MPFAINRGVKIYYQDQGEGDLTVVLLHGLGAPGRCWFALPNRLVNESQRRLRVICIDNRGTGKSDKPLKPWRMADMADDVGAVLNAAGVSQAIIAGLSMGGKIAQHVALRYPNKVSGLLLMATTPGTPHTQYPSKTVLRKAFQLPFARGDKARELMSFLLLTPQEKKNIHVHMAGWREALLAEGASPLSFFLQLYAISTHRMDNNHQHITCPTHILVGEQDAFVPPGNSQALSRLMPHAELKILPDVGHSVDILAQDDIVRSVSELSEQIL